MDLVFIILIVLCIVGGLFFIHRYRVLISKVKEFLESEAAPGD